jgi:hypothetical protein
MPIRLCANPKCGDVAVTRGRCAVHAADQRRANRSANDASIPLASGADNALVSCSTTQCADEKAVPQSLSSPVRN